MVMCYLMKNRSIVILFVWFSPLSHTPYPWGPQDLSTDPCTRAVSNLQELTWLSLAREISLLELVEKLEASSCFYSHKTS